MEYYSSTEWQSLLADIAERADQVDLELEWPRHQFELLARAGVTAIGIPAEFGGGDFSRREVCGFYLDCAQACLTTAFVFSQRNAAVQRIVDSSAAELKQRVLPQLASGELMATVGISHLSTSRQHLAEPAVKAESTDDGFALNGFVPWVTSAGQADFVLTGGTLDDGRQMLGLLEKGQEGVEISTSARMLALSGSATGNMKLNRVLIPKNRIVADPVEGVMKAGGGGTGSLTTSTLALGVAKRAVVGLQQEAQKRAELQPQSEQFTEELSKIIENLLTATESNSHQEEKYQPGEIRKRANSIVLRASQAYLTAVKGSGFLSGHPAERTVREAMFFLVWSCPQPVAEAAMREFACTPGFA